MRATGISSTRGYRLFDEPRPGALAKLAVDPLWPLLAIMFGGAWLSWPWFAVNAFAIGSPTRRREALLAAGGFAGTALLLATLVGLGDAGVLAGIGLSYATVSLVVWKLAVSYWLYVQQARTFALFQHFHGATGNGLVVVAVGWFLGRRLLAALDGVEPFGGLLRVVLQ